MRRFLAGPQPRLFELARAMRIFCEFIRGFRALHFVGPCVTVFGSARITETHRYYELARQLGACLARDGFTVMTGGGPGTMEAANRGAKEVGGRSIGCNIELPQEQPTDRDLLFVTDSPEEAAARVRDIGMKQFGLTYERPIKPR